MSEPRGSLTGSWGWLNATVGVLLLGLVVGAVLLWVKGPEVVPGQSEAERLSAQYADVTRAARAESLAFLTVDYKQMDPLIERVLAGATGDFKSQYAKSQVDIKASAQQSQATATTTVKSIGIGELNTGQATVFVAADSSVTNKLTKGKAQPRYYRLQLTMKRSQGRWLTSDLQFVS